MLVYLIQCYFLVTTNTILPVHGQACHTGWFGPGCKYMCHCSGNAQCDSRGRCSGNVACERYYFGPGCQNVDILGLYSINPPHYLIDNDDTTCNQKMDDSFLQLNFGRELSVKWFRIIVKDTVNVAQNMSFIAFFNGYKSCQDERRFILSKNIVDVVCSGQSLMSMFSIDGDIVGSVCSIYISGGRNVALKENTNQTNTFTYDNKVYSSDLAVDGNQSDNFEDGTCTHTQPGTVAPRFVVTLSRPASIYAIRLINRNDYQHRLVGMNISLYTDANLIDYTYAFRFPLDIYYIPIVTNTPIKYITIQLGTWMPLNDSFLTVCEVEVYGDTLCPDNTFGFLCDRTCKCNETDDCNLITGVCTSVCKSGFFGSNCESQCSVNCLFGKCLYHNGNCKQCIPGYKGDFCSEACPPGTYGEQCGLNCSRGCANACKVTNGVCTCRMHFAGFLCADCRPGMFGSDCQFECSPGCADKCSMINGHCRCKKGYTGSFCSDCRPGMFGSNCQYNCSSGCDGGCNRTSGHCTCKEEYTGLLCSECRLGLKESSCHVRCSKGCKNTCNDKTGHCTCLDRYTGLLCLECLPGAFGSDCEFNCSKGCYDICSNTTGHCACRYGYDGLMCTDCKPSNFGSDCELTCPRGCANNCNRTNLRCFACSQGWYDVFCDKHCSEFCFGKLCNMSTGDCFVCFGNRVGRLCQECNHSYYGLRCESQCSEHCINKTCDHVSGKCPKCRKGFKGQMCLQDVEKPSPWVAPITILPFFLLVLMCLPEQTHDEDDDDDDDNDADDANMDRTSLSDKIYTGT